MAYRGRGSSVPPAADVLDIFICVSQSLVVAVTGLCSRANTWVNRHPVPTGSCGGGANSASTRRPSDASRSGQRIMYATRKVARIRAEEERLAAHLQSVCHDLERRIVVRKERSVEVMNSDELNDRRVVALAKYHKCSTREICSALDKHPLEVDRDAYFRRTVALELVRLDQLEEAFVA